MSPTPGRSTLMTSAPNQARSCVQVGPDCTCVKSRIRTPSRAFIAFPPLFLFDHALWVEVADAAAFRAGRWVDHRVDEGRLAGIHGRAHGAVQLVRRRYV